MTSTLLAVGASSPSLLAPLCGRVAPHLQPHRASCVCPHRSLAILYAHAGLAGNRPEVIQTAAGTSALMATTV